MKITGLKIFGIVFVVLALGFVGIYFFSIKVFGTSTETTCSSKRAQTLLLDANNKLIVDDSICDDGLNVSGSYTVSIEIHDGSDKKTIEILRQSNMQSAAHVPTARLLSATQIEIRAQKSLTVKTGSSRVGIFYINY